jgi:phage gpG-like protein
MTRVTFKPGAKIKRWEAQLDDPKKALKQIGVLLVAASQASFKAQKLGDEKWDERRVPNVFGIVSDFHAGKAKPPARRFQDRPALRDTGRLAQSIAFKLESAKVVAVGSNLPYASVHQFGGPVESLPVTKTIQKRIAKWLVKSGRKWANDLQFLISSKMTGKQLKGEVPARPFVGLTKQVSDDIVQVVGREVMEID